MTTLTPGTRVADMDPGLAALRNIMRSAGHEPSPNHHGTIDRVEGDTAYVQYDDGGYAPCPLAQLVPL